MTEPKHRITIGRIVDVELHVRGGFPGTYILQGSYDAVRWFDLAPGVVEKVTYLRAIFKSQEEDRR